jgi:hypothetical protein
MQENAYHPITHARLGLAIENDGFAIVENCVDESTINQQCVSLDGNTHGQRNLLGVPSVRQLAASESVRSLVEEVLGPDCRAVKGILFNKTPESNWKVAWHQELTIAVRQRRQSLASARGLSRTGSTTFSPLQRSSLKSSPFASIATTTLSKMDRCVLSQGVTSTAAFCRNKSPAGTSPQPRRAQSLEEAHCSCARSYCTLRLPA